MSQNYLNVWIAKILKASRQLNLNKEITKNIWHRFSGPDTEAGMVEVSYTSLRAVYRTVQYSTVQYSTVCTGELHQPAGGLPRAGQLQLPSGPQPRALRVRLPGRRGALPRGPLRQHHQLPHPLQPQRAQLRLLPLLATAVRLALLLHTGQCHVSRVTIVTRVMTDRAVQHAGQHAPRGAAGAPQHPGAVQDHAEERDGARGGLQDLQHGPQQR